MSSEPENLADPIEAPYGLRIVTKATQKDVRDWMRVDAFLRGVEREDDAFDERRC